MEMKRWSAISLFVIPFTAHARISRSRSLITSRGCILSVSGAALVFTDFRTVLSSFLSVGTNKAFSSLQCVSRSFSQVYISKSTSFSKFTFSDGTLYFISRLFNSLSFNSIAECPRRNCSTGREAEPCPSSRLFTYVNILLFSNSMCLRTSFVYSS